MTGSSKPDLRSDCSNCCGLCCVAPDQLSTQDFAADKPADTPCQHLDEHNRCRIHDTRAEDGYGACQGFECFGAGQWITQHLFSGADWRDSDQTAEQMFAAYRQWLPRFEAAAMIETALPMVSDTAQPALLETLQQLTSEQAKLPVNGQALRNQVLSQIRAAMDASPRAAATPVRLTDVNPIS